MRATAAAYHDWFWIHHRHVQNNQLITSKGLHGVFETIKEMGSEYFGPGTISTWYIPGGSNGLDSHTDRTTWTFRSRRPKFTPAIKAISRKENEEEDWVGRFGPENKTSAPLPPASSRGMALQYIRRPLPHIIQKKVWQQQSVAGRGSLWAGILLLSFLFPQPPSSNAYYEEAFSRKEAGLGKHDSRKIDQYMVWTHSSPECLLNTLYEPISVIIEMGKFLALTTFVLSFQQMERLRYRSVKILFFLRSQQKFSSLMGSEKRIATYRHHPHRRFCNLNFPP